MRRWPRRRPRTRRRSPDTWRAGKYGRCCRRWTLWRRYGGGRLRGERVAEHRDMGAADAARTVVAPAGNDLRLEAASTPPSCARWPAARPRVPVGPVGGGGDQCAQDDAAPGHQLLDVHDVHGVRGEGLEEPCGDAGTVLAEDLDEQGGYARPVRRWQAGSAMRSWCSYGNRPAERPDSVRGSDRRVPSSAPSRGGRRCPRRGCPPPIVTDRSGSRPRLPTASRAPRAPPPARPRTPGRGGRRRQAARRPAARAVRTAVPCP